MPDTVKVILLKKEGVYGTDAAPTPAANAVVTRNFTSRPLEVDTLGRDLDLPGRGRTRSANTKRRTSFGFELDLAGSGATGTASPFMELLEACGMAAPALTAATKAEQKFAGVGVVLSSLTAHHWMGGQRSRALGSRGKFGLDFTAGRYPFAKFDFVGLLPPPPAVDSVAPGAASDFTRWKDPLEVNTANTDFTIDGFALALESLTMEDGAANEHVALVGEEYVSRSNHALTGRIRGKAPDLAAKNFFSTLDTGAEVPIALNHGTVAGNIIELESSYLQVTAIERSERNDVMFLDITFGLNIRNGSDDLLIRAR
jgi:hypothetical protein